MSPRAVFLANDVVSDYCLAFLESFREHNPDMTLSMMPYSNEIEFLTRLSHIYNFDVLDIDVRKWDELSKEFFPGAKSAYNHRLRKLCMFDLCESPIIYIDIDTVILHPFSVVATPILSGQTEIICTAINNDPWVYLPSYGQHSKLASSKRFSDGFIAFDGAKISGDTVYNTLCQNKELFLSVRAPRVYSQPATNFVVDMLGLVVEELSVACPEMSPLVWFKDDGIVPSFPGNARTTDGRNLLFVHWAGPVNVGEIFRHHELFTYFYSRARNRLIESGMRAFLGR